MPDCGGERAPLLCAVGVGQLNTGLCSHSARQATSPETRLQSHGHQQGPPLTVMLVSFLPLWEDATTARYWMTFLVFSVFPAPDSPLKDRGMVTRRK